MRVLEGVLCVVGCIECDARSRLAIGVKRRWPGAAVLAGQLDRAEPADCPRAVLDPTPEQASGWWQIRGDRLDRRTNDGLPNLTSNHGLRRWREPPPAPNCHRGCG